MEDKAIQPGIILAACGMAAWILSSVLPSPIDLTAAAAPAFMIGPILQWRKKGGKSIKIEWKLTDWIGLTIFVTALVAVAKGYDPVTIIRALSAKS